MKDPGKQGETNCLTKQEKLKWAIQNVLPNGPSKQTEEFEVVSFFTDLVTIVMTFFELSINLSNWHRNPHR